LVTKRICPPDERRLRQVVRRQDLHFLDGIGVERADHGAGRSRPRGDRAVHGDQVLVAAAAVDVEAAVGQAVGEKRIHRVAAADARLQHREVDRVSPVQRHVLEVLRLDRLAVLGVEGERCGLRLHEHRFADDAGVERRVERQLGGGVEAHAALRPLLEAGQLDVDVVGAGVVEDGITRAVARARQTGLRVGDGDGGAGDDAAGLILDDAGDLAAIELGQGGRRGEADQCEHCEPGAQPDQSVSLHVSTSRLQYL
jgi:hypothetical protein